VTRYFATLIRVIVTPAIYRCLDFVKKIDRHSTEQDSHLVRFHCGKRDAAFLLNSWALLVTIGSDFHQSQALSRSYSSNWPNSLSKRVSMAIVVKLGDLMRISVRTLTLFSNRSQLQTLFIKKDLPLPGCYSLLDEFPRTTKC